MTIREREMQEYTKKYVLQSLKFKKVEEAIHARWEIEEKAIIFFKELRLNPPRGPTTLDEMTKINKINKLLAGNNRVKGAIFCHVRRIAPLFQLISSITWGNQKWVGAIPDFTPRAVVINLFG
jgi:hypothetical protein